MPAPRTVHVRLIPSTPVARRRYRLEYAAATDDLSTLERVELTAHRAAGRVRLTLPVLSVDDVRAGWIDAGRTHRARVAGGWRVGAVDYAAGFAARVIAARLSTRTARQLAAVVIVLCTLALSITAAPDADAATTGPDRAAQRAWAVAVPLTPWLPPCATEDGSDCTDPAGDWTATRDAAGAVCVYFAPGFGETDYCTADAYPPAGAPAWEQLTDDDARAVADELGGPVSGWAACAVTVTGEPMIVCPGGGLPSNSRTA